MKFSILMSFLLDEGKNEFFLKVGKLLMIIVLIFLIIILNVLIIDFIKIIIRVIIFIIIKIVIIKIIIIVSLSFISIISVILFLIMEYVFNYWDFLMNRYGLKIEGIEEGFFFLN